MQIVRNAIAGILQFPFGALGGLLFVSGCFAFLSQVYLWLKFSKWVTVHQLVKQPSTWQGVPSVYTNEEVVVGYLSRFTWLNDWKGLEQTLIWFLTFHPVVIALFLGLIVYVIEALCGSNNLSD